MNLVTDSAWIPIRRLSTQARDWIAPYQFSDPDIDCFDAPRPDFNGALAQFAIGLLQTTMAPKTSSERQQLFLTPPQEDELKSKFASVSSAFELDGEGPRFMQDLSLKPEDGATNNISALLIDAPGENTQKNNTDHFIKRGYAEVMCADCAATALLTLQINAPSGGQGHRTGLRGGGPLTTLLICERKSDDGPRSLWHDLWLNVLEQSTFEAKRCDSSLTEPHFTFPWLKEIVAIQKPDGETAPIQVHPAHIFWAMPRRIRLDFSDVSAGLCAICGRASERLVKQYVTKNYGLNYKGDWNHPLAPYYNLKNEWLPLHPQPGGIGYRHWLAWVLGVKTAKSETRKADVVSQFLNSTRGRMSKQALRLWAFGFDMDNMKARCWYESTLPVYGLPECEPAVVKRISAEVAGFTQGADQAAMYLRNAVKDAWFSRDARGDFSMVDASFWSATEPDFYTSLSTLIASFSADEDFDPAELRQAFYLQLVAVALRLFEDTFVGTGAIARQNPRRVKAAREQLEKNLRGPIIRANFGFEVRPQKAKSSRSKKAEA